MTVEVKPLAEITQEAIAVQEILKVTDPGLDASQPRAAQSFNAGNPKGDIRWVWEGVWP